MSGQEKADVGSFKDAQGEAVAAAKGAAEAMLKEIATQGSGGGGNGPWEKGGRGADGSGDVNNLPPVERTQRRPESTESGIAVAFDNAFTVTEKERKAAIDSAGKSLEKLVKGELQMLKELMQRQGFNTQEVDSRLKAADDQIAMVKPLQEAILKGDMKALQKLVAQTDPAVLQKMVDLLEKNFDALGTGLVLDVVDGKLVLSSKHGDRAVSIGKDKLDVIGVNPDGSYDFNRHFRRENPAAELDQLTSGAVRRINDPWYGHKRPYIEKEVLPRFNNIYEKLNHSGR